MPLSIVHSGHTRSVQVSGTAENSGNVAVGAGATVAVAMTGPQDLLVNAGTVHVAAGATLGVAGGQVLNNGGILAEGGHVVLTTELTGSGVVALLAGPQFQAPSVELGGIVGSDQTVALDAGTLTLDDPHDFLGTIQDWGAAGSIRLAHVTATDLNWANGILSVRDGFLTEAQLHVAGSYGADSFAFANGADGAVTLTAHPA